MDVWGKAKREGRAVPIKAWLVLASETGPFRFEPNQRAISLILESSDFEKMMINAAQYDASIAIVSEGGGLLEIRLYQTNVREDGKTFLVNSGDRRDVYTPTP